jgi:hypothetical protein
MSFQRRWKFVLQLRGSLAEILGPLGTGRPRPLSSSFRLLIPKSAGTTRSGSRSLLALSAPSNTERVSDLRLNPVQVSPSACLRPHVMSLADQMRLILHRPLLVAADPARRFLAPQVLARAELGSVSLSLLVLRPRCFVASRIRLCFSTWGAGPVHSVPQTPTPAKRNAETQ